MCPFPRPAALPEDLRLTVRCLLCATLALTLALSPLRRAAEPDAVAVFAMADVAPTTLGDDLDATLLARTIAETMGDASYAAQLALGAAIVNRIPDPRYPSALGDILADAGLRLLPRGEAIPARSRRAAEAALLGVDPTGGALRWGKACTMPSVTFDGIAFGK